MSDKLTKKSAIVEIFAKTAMNSKMDSEVEKSDYKDAVKVIQELATNPNPMNRYELNQIVGYTVDNVLDVRLNYLPLVAEVKNTAFDERPKFKVKTEGITAFWQAIGSTTQRTKVGAKYSDLTLKALSARPIAEWAEIAAGRYNFEELIRDVANEFEAKIAQEIQTTLYATYTGLTSSNYNTGSGVVAGSFDPILVTMQRFGKCAIIGDYAALQKLAALTGFTSATSTLQFSPTLIDEQNRNGFIGVYKGASVVQLDNPYAGLTGFTTVLDPGYIYIVPAVSNEMKTLKVQFAGGTLAMEGQNIDDFSYDMRFDKHMGAGIVDARHAMGVYIDSAL
jgi:hypothetical protein